MIKNYIPRRPEEIIERSIEFTDEEGGGFRFDADVNGGPIFAEGKMGEIQRANYAYALTQEKRFTVQYNEFVVNRRTYMNDAEGDCFCGEHLILYNQYQGACQCPKCGRWYNVFGQALIDPMYWED